ncbi:MAG: dTDP-4-dehydrorhamnose 3,5-epimerase [Pseudomonadota bacterium]
MMNFIKTSIDGAYHIKLEAVADHRGYLARSFCAETFSQKGLVSEFVQSNISYNSHRGTLRGLHFQSLPYQETKLIRCSRGAIFDVMVDLRKDSASYLKTFSIELKQENLSMLYIPAGVAHGFQTLEDHTELSYQMSMPYQAEYAQGIRWDDPLFNISWPIDHKILSARDQALSFWKV